VAFLTRVSPVSTKANPACMKNTKAPVMISHSMSMAPTKASVLTTTSAKTAMPTLKVSKSNRAVLFPTIPSSSKGITLIWQESIHV
jgi:hypothetical protein